MGIKTYTVKGVTYRYHRETNTRLPDLPFEHPKFQAALQLAEDKVVHRSRRRRRKTADLPDESVNLSPNHPIDVVAYTVHQCATFVLKAKPKQTLHYHSGSIARDSQKDELVREKHSYLRLCEEFGLLRFSHARIKEGWNHYFVIRSETPLKGMPQRALHHDITPEEYRALVAINERQASVSTTRAIRDALTIGDNAASELRNAMIRKGWMTNTRPPELTELGLSLLC